MENIFNQYVLRITENHTGKMKGLQSLSTNAMENKQCNKNCLIDGAICQKCYARKMLKRYKTLYAKLTHNYNVATTQIIPIEYLPTINALYFRFEAFGDLENEYQFINYLNICYKNQQTSFALWTKNPHIIDSVLNDMGYKKPKNLNIIVSSLFINKEWNYKKLPYAKRYNFIDKIFTVYDKQYIKENNININCGALNCNTCLKCYTKNDIKIINERLK